MKTMYYLGELDHVILSKDDIIRIIAGHYHVDTSSIRFPYDSGAFTAKVYLGFDAERIDRQNDLLRVDGE